MLVLKGIFEGSLKITLQKKARNKRNLKKILGGGVKEIPWVIKLHGRLDAALSPCNFATSHFPAERSSFVTL